MSQKDALLEATETLLWEHGYESMSPKMILRRSGAGQGSMYHHFSGKKDLAIAALGVHEAFLRKASHEILDGPGTPLARIERWLKHPRDGLAGCRLGRLANERAFRDDGELRAPLRRYFDDVQQTLRSLLEEAEKAGQLRGAPGADELATMLVATVQGAFVVSLATGESDAMRAATSAAWRLLTCFQLA